MQKLYVNSRTNFELGLGNLQMFVYVETRPKRVKAESAATILGLISQTKALLSKVANTPTAATADEESGGGYHHNLIVQGVSRQINCIPCSGGRATHSKLLT